MTSFRLAVLAVCFASILTANAQDQGNIDFRATIGTRNALSEGTCGDGKGQVAGGASVRFYTSPRLSIGPEVLFFGACERQSFTFYHPQISGMIHLAVDLTRGQRILPYVLGGGGFVRHRSLPGRSPVYRFEAAGGGGARIVLSERLFVAPEVQFGGRAAFFRFTGSLGILLN